MREMDYTRAARAMGASSHRIILRHLMPTPVAPFLIIMSSMSGIAIRTVAGFSLLELGISEPTPSRGRMPTGQAAQYLATAAWILNFPGIIITVTLMAFPFAGVAVRDTFENGPRHDPLALL